MELGLLTDDEACEPSRSSGSHNSCSMRLMPSCETLGREGNLRDCFQFKIFPDFGCDLGYLSAELLNKME